MAKSSPRAFVDTNVLFSGLYSALGPPAAILEYHTEGTITIVISRQVLEELVSTIRAKKPDLLVPLQIFLTNAPPEMCADPSTAQVLRARSWINRSDAPILAAAMGSGADCLVTGNTHHFTVEVARAAKLAILTPAQYVAQLGSMRE